MPVRPGAWLALLLLTGLLAPAALAQVPRVVPALVELRAGYGSEAWKDEPPLGAVAGGLPVSREGALGVYANPYADGAPHQGAQPWLGHNLTATIELRDEAGAAVASGAHYLAARLEGGGATVPAKLARLAPGRFAAQFDLDGEAGDEAVPALPPGAARIVAEVYEATPDPTVADRRVARAEFQVQALAAAFDLGGFRLADAALGFADTGAGDGALVLGTLARPGEPFAVQASLGAPRAPAALVAWARGRLVPLAEGLTDGAGVLAASFDASQLLGANESGLALLEAHLDGSQGRVASAVLAVPVSSHPTKVARFVHEPRAGGAADTLLVGVEDRTAGAERPARGAVHVLDRAGATVASAPFEPTGFGPSAGERTARLPAAQLPREGYRVVALLQTGDGRLYSLAQATRGLDVVVLDARGRPFEAGNLTVLVRNLGHNLDDAVDDGLALAVRVNATGLPGGGEAAADVEVPEGGEARLSLPFLADAGRYAVEVTAAAGELRATSAATLLVEEAPRALLPGPGPLLAVAAALLLAQRRRSRA